MTKKPLSPAKSLTRRGSRFTQRPSFLLVCEGKRTEPDYFTYVKNQLRVNLDFKECNGDPLKLVEFAIRQRINRSREAKRAGDHADRVSIWCVFDVDNHQRLEPALRLARNEDINTAVSNPCFEIWLLLHFKDVCQYLTSDQAAIELSKFMRGYDKRPDCHKLLGSYDAAKKRSMKLATMHDRNGNPTGSNPSTAIFRLVDALIETSEIPGPGAPRRPHSL